MDWFLYDRDIHHETVTTIAGESQTGLALRILEI